MNAKEQPNPIYKYCTDEPAPYVESETRFAVVMYGGISLAIYIHGVAQELYHMVRATARVVDKTSGQEYYRFCKSDLSEPERIYRVLGETLKTKFVVDILSGTSAGGINAIFLAKALVNDRKMDFIKDFWIQQGDISKLINDGDSLNGVGGLSLQIPPLGLLNSQRFYFKLLQALKEMGSTDDENHVSPYVEDLDLNITATDIRGLDLPLFINNTNVIREPRFRNVFQFVYRPWVSENNQVKGVAPRNDFTQRMDPFLAFAARCTASIPPAFEAMQLKDIEPILGTSMFKDDYGALSIHDEEWKKRFYKEYANAGDNFVYRSFGDGGYLDNKPFSYATEALLRRTATVPVDRKLVYIEPSPEHPEDKPLPLDRPDMIQNILAAILTLPRSETIRDDLERIQNRNNIIRRVKRMISGVSYLVPYKGQKVGSLKWASQYLMDESVLERYGRGYIAYHQLMVETVVDHLSATFARAMGWNEGSEEEGKIYTLMRKLIEKRYHSKKPPPSPDGKRRIYSQNDLLYRLDLSYRMRRCYFLQGILNTIIRELGDTIDKKKRGEIPVNSELQKIFVAAGLDLEIAPNFDWNSQATSDLIGLLSVLKNKINKTYIYMKLRAQQIRKNNLVDDKTIEDGMLLKYQQKLSEIMPSISKIDMHVEQNEDFLKLIDSMEDLTITLSSHLDENGETSGYLSETMKVARDEDERNGFRKSPDKRVPNLIRRKELLETLKTIVHDKVGDQKDNKYLTPTRIGIYLRFYQQVQTCLAYYYDNYDYYDYLIFPAQYGTDTGETDEVEVIRVSPADATQIIDERRLGRKKLAGTAFSNFGAFFKDEWRANDILWGRLDAAEILTEQVLGSQSERQVKWKEFLGRLAMSPEKDTVFSKIKELALSKLFQSILEEDLRPRDKSIFYALLDRGQEFLENISPAAASKDEKKFSREIIDLDEREKQLDKLGVNISGRIADRFGNEYPGLGERLNEVFESEKEKIKQAREKILYVEKINREAANELKKLNEQSGKRIDEMLKGFDAPRKKLAGTLEKLKEVNAFRFNDVMRAFGDNELLEYFKYGYLVDTSFEPKTSLETTDRSAKVLNALLGGLSDRYPVTRLSGVLRLFSRLLSSLVVFAVPGTAGNFLLEKQWIWLVYLMGGILFFASQWTKNEEIKNIASLVLLVAVTVHFTVLSVREWLSRKKRNYWVWFYVALVALVGLGIWQGNEAVRNIGAFSLAATVLLHISLIALTQKLPAWVVFSIKAIRFLLLLALAAMAVIVLYAGLAFLKLVPLPEFFLMVVRFIQEKSIY